jgi:WD40 repeat protein/uncharacterized caspase-like protein
MSIRVLLFILFQLTFILIEAQTNQSPRLVLPIGHTDDIERIEISSNEKLILTKSKDNSCRLYDFQTGYELYSFQNNSGNEIDVSFSPKSNYIIVETEEKTQIIELSNYSKKSEFTKLFNVRIDEAEEFVIGCSEDESISLYKISDGKLVSSKDEFWGVEIVEFVKNSKYLISYTSEKQLIFLEKKKLKEIGKRIEIQDEIQSYEFSSDGQYLVLEERGNLFEVIDLIGRKRIGVFTNPKNWFQLVKFSNDNKSIVSCSDTVVRVFNLNPFEEKCSFVVPVNQLSDIFFSPDGKDILTVDWDGKIKVFNSSNGQFKKEYDVTKEIISDAALDLLGKNIITGNYDNSFSRFDLEESRLVYNSKGSTLKVTNSMFLNNSSYVVYAANDTMYSIAKLFDAKNGMQVSLYDDYGKEIYYHDLLKKDLIDPLQRIRLVPLKDNSFGFTYNSNYANKILKKFVGHNSPVRLLSFNYDKSQIVSGSEDGLIKIWDAESGANHITISIDKEKLESVRFNPNGNKLITASDGKVRIWDANTGNALSFIKFPAHIRDAAFSSKDELIFGICGNGFDKDSVVIYNLESKKVLILARGHNGVILSVSCSSDNKYIVTTGADHKTILWDVQAGKIIYTRLQLENNDWLVYDEDYRFDGSPGAIEKLYFTCGLEIIELGQMKDALYVPGLAEKLMNGEDVNYKKLGEIDICGALPLIDKLKEDSSGWQFSIQQRRWPIVRIEIKVDGKIVKTLPIDQLIFIQNLATLDLKRAELEKYFVNGKENKISISAITKENGVEIISRGIDVFVLTEESADPTQMYMLMIGVNDYKDDALDLRFPVQDARALSNAIEMSTSKMLGAENIHVYHVESKLASNEVFTTPERAGVMKALAEIGSKAKANDLLFIFFAGHGIMQGQVDKTFTFLTADASQINQIGISTNDLKSWLSPEGPFKMLPNKTILVYDACNSGQAAKELVAALTRDDDATERQRQIEELGDKSGLFILSASAPNKPAYELPQFGQGILTYSLLYTLKNNPSILDQEEDGNGYLNLQKWFLATEQEQSRRMEALGLKQDAQPYGAGNIRLGLVDNELRQSIKLADEKPLVFCANARDENDEDPLELKKAVNNYFEHALSRGSDSPVAFVSAETPQANVIKLIYSIKKEKVECRILVFKNKIKIQETILSDSIETIPSKIAEAVSNLIVH